MSVPTHFAHTQAFPLAWSGTWSITAGLTLRFFPRMVVQGAIQVPASLYQFHPRVSSHSKPVACSKNRSTQALISKWFEVFPSLISWGKKRFLHIVHSWQNGYKPPNKSTDFTECKLPSHLPLPRRVRTASNTTARVMKISWKRVCWG